MHNLLHSPTYFSGEGTCFCKMVNNLKFFRRIAQDVNSIYWEHEGRWAATDKMRLNKYKSQNICMYDVYNTSIFTHIQHTATIDLIICRGRSRNIVGAYRVPVPFNLPPSTPYGLMHVASYWKDKNTTISYSIYSCLYNFQIFTTMTHKWKKLYGVVLDTHSCALKSALWIYVNFFAMHQITSLLNHIY